jgi:hypothetical protein
MYASPYSLRVYDKEAGTNVHAATFLHTPADRNVMLANVRAVKGKRFLVYPSDSTKRILQLAPDEILCVYHKEQLITWTKWDHVIYPSFEFDSDDESFVLLVKGESKEQCYEALLQARRFLIN